MGVTVDFQSIVGCERSDTHADADGSLISAPCSATRQIFAVLPNQRSKFSADLPDTSATRFLGSDASACRRSSTAGGVDDGAHLLLKAVGGPMEAMVHSERLQWVYTMRS